MSVRPFEQHVPRVHPTAFVDDTAVVIGDVDIGEHSSVWPLCVVRGDIQSIRIGARTSIQDGTIIHVTHDSRFCPGGQPTLVGNDVTVGHKTILHACTIEDYCLIGMGAIVMDKAVVQAWVTLGAGSVVPPGKVLDSGYLYVGSPAKRVRPLSERERDFLGYSPQNYQRLKDRHQALLA
ncbi:MAG: gamma carbonic anhydrase family protein [Candidatus Competibacter sp.]|nr:gamma carbonic anhydrase family protein [Candidatus Competibacteraceae bacterium]MBK7983419.1 gamma carbonic anhydrase family protein [Candidatus Competibacteraceae bacterium]MBK8961845.1 gamma carbonic anhydrase family protein [Candidatus Competibacteraceae bacterium]